MSEPVRVIGSYLSPYVRKVLVCLDLKGIGYEIDPIVPFFGDERFSRLSPLRRIPVLVDGGLTLADSSIICQYLEDRQPDLSLYPLDVADRARARWLEEYADTRIADVLIRRVFDQLVINPHVWSQPTDEAVVKQALEVDIPDVLDYLELQLPRHRFCFGEVSIADVSIACVFRTAGFAGFHIESSRWPRAAGLVDRVLRLPVFQSLAGFEDATIRTPVPRHRETLRALGAPLTRDTCGGAAPRQGIVPI